MAEQPDLPLTAAPAATPTPAPEVAPAAAPVVAAAEQAPAASGPKLSVTTPTTPTTPLEPEIPRVAEVAPEPAKTEPAKAEEPQKEEAKAEPVKAEGEAGDKTLLEEVAGAATKVDEKKGAEPAKAEAKPAEKKAEEAPKEGETKPVEFQKVEYDYKLPDNVKLSDDEKGSLNGLLDDFRKDPAKSLQPLVDFHVQAVNKIVEQVRNDQQEVFRRTRGDWQKAIKSDPILGGNGFETAKVVVAEGRDFFVSEHEPGTPEYDRDTREFDHLTKYTGAGDHPAFWRLLYNMGQFRRSVLGRQGPPNIQAAPHGRAPNARGRASLYDNPTSPNNKS